MERKEVEKEEEEKEEKSEALGGQGAKNNGRAYLCRKEKKKM